MTSKEETLASLARRITELRDTLGKIVGEHRRISSLRRHQFIHKVFEATAEVVYLQSAVWDLAPDLVEPSFIPSPTIDLTEYFRVIHHGNEMMRADAVRGIMSYAPDDVVKEAKSAPTEDERVEVLRRWWRTQPVPTSAIHRLDRELDSDRRWRRVHAARKLVHLGEPSLEDARHCDVDRDAVERWRSNRKEPSTPKE